MAKKGPPQKEWFGINEAILEIVALTQSEIEKNRISLETQLSDDLPLILGDRVQLQQVILNLAINAIEALSAVGEGSRDLLIRTARGGSKDILITVSDSGRGVDPKDIDRVFDAFYTTKGDGMGLGLTISRSIIEAHGGRLWVTPNAPRGATFQLTVPIRGDS